MIKKKSATFVSFEGEIHREFFFKPESFSAGPVVCVTDGLSHRSDYYQYCFSCMFIHNNNTET